MNATLAVLLGVALVLLAAGWVLLCVGWVVYRRAAQPPVEQTPAVQGEVDPAPTPPPPKVSLLQRLLAAVKALGPIIKTSVSLRQAPTWWVAGLTVIDSALTVLNQTTLPQAIGYGGQIKLGTTLILGAIAFLGIGPVLGAKFRTYVHLSPRLAGAISVGLLVGEVAIQTDTHLPYSAIVLGAIQFAGGLGFAPAYVPTL